MLKLTNSEILQTEVRVLYELLYVLNNSYRGNKTFKGLQQVWARFSHRQTLNRSTTGDMFDIRYMVLQVEQCVNRLKNMKLVEALREMSDVCPTKIQRWV